MIEEHGRANPPRVRGSTPPTPLLPRVRGSLCGGCGLRPAVSLERCNSCYRRWRRLQSGQIQTTRGDPAVRPGKKARARLFVAIHAAAGAEWTRLWVVAARVGRSTATLQRLLRAAVHGDDEYRATLPGGIEAVKDPREGWFLRQRPASSGRAS